jgi:2-polyprenyl-6-hydroxyphenyl methylase/3-demethylubiquinone-9 3-methyltransferase
LKALALYRDMPAAVRLHTRLRAFSCPMAAVLGRVPRAGSLLEVGCGHGLFANEAALENPELQVLGIDPAADKIRWAQGSVGDRSGIGFREGRLEALKEGPFDAVAVLDVLYLVPRTDWPAFLGACRERLRPGGKLLLKEVDVRPRWKFYRCWLQESLSVRLLGITLGREFAFAGREEMLGLLRGAGFATAEATDLGRGYLTPHVLYEAARS